MKFAQVLTLTVGLLATYARASEATPEDNIVNDIPIVEDDVEIPKSILFLPTKRVAHFLDQFIPETVARWIPSEAKKIVDGIEDEDLLKFRGRWNVEEPVVLPGLRGDRGLTVKTAAAHHAVSASFKTPFDTNGKTLVAQYEVKLQNGLECGGAYMKLLTYDSKFTPAQFSDKTPYTIMFGPDRCGETNKFHFIFRHQNPVSKEWEEKYMKSVVTAKVDKLSNVYTLVIRPNQSFEVLVNGESQKKGSLLKDVEPPVNPPKLIDDPKDQKPEDWIENAKIPDPDATKPADWDESAPREIVDEDATVGVFLSSFVVSVLDLKFLGKWKAPIIDNPDYKGPWPPKKIPNPTYFEDCKPSNMGKIGAIGFELWTMQDGIQFDNIWIGDSEKEAKAFRIETWAAKYKLENAKLEEEKKKEPEAPVDPNATWYQKAMDKAAKFRERIYKFVLRASSWDWFEASLDDPVAVGTCVLLVLYVLNSLWMVLSSIAGFFARPAVPKEKKE
ncbi:UNVERIFIED_CONTAM: hypothetical protein HDU68_001220 [Siphonaria sp. JEL0065]|nr:hypothetical protein HDU68_001220 [Siphonaria sp. JEL0065]